MPSITMQADELRKKATSGISYINKERKRRLREVYEKNCYYKSWFGIGKKVKRWKDFDEFYYFAQRYTYGPGGSSGISYASNLVFWNGGVEHRLKELVIASNMGDPVTLDSKDICSLDTGLSWGKDRGTE